MNFKILLTIGTFFMSLSVVFAECDTINQLDSLGNKQGYWVYYGKDRPSAGYPENGIVEEGFYVDNRKNGLWKKYFEDGKTVRLAGEYKNNRPNGRYKKYFSDKTLREEGSFNRGKYKGTLRRFHQNGQLQYFGKYNDVGKSIDTALHFFKNGCLELMYVFHSDGTPKTSYLYYPDSCNAVKSTEENLPIISNSRPVKTTIDKKANVKVHRRKVSSRYSGKRARNEYSDAALCSGEDLSFNKIYNDNDEIIFDGMCKSGKVWDGKMYFYDKDGILLFVEIWKNGEYQSDGFL